MVLPNGRITTYSCSQITAGRDCQHVLQVTPLHVHGIIFHPDYDRFELSERVFEGRGWWVPTELLETCQVCLKAPSARSLSNCRAVVTPWDRPDPGDFSSTTQKL